MFTTACNYLLTIEGHSGRAATHVLTEHIAEVPIVNTATMTMKLRPPHQNLLDLSHDEASVTVPSQGRTRECRASSSVRRRPHRCCHLKHYP
jgi:hypothetical protein